MDTGARARDPVPVACTLEAAAMPGRLVEWRALAERATSQHRGEDGTMHLGFGDVGILDDVARLVALEQACCAFFTFVITVNADGVGLDVRAPVEAADLVVELFGSPA